MSKKKSPRSKYRPRKPMQKSDDTPRRAASSSGSASRNSQADANAHFSLKDEARLTGGRQRFWAIDTKLRNRRVQFVSAGMHSTKYNEVAQSSDDAPMSVSEPSTKRQNADVEEDNATMQHARPSKAQTVQPFHPAANVLSLGAEHERQTAASLLHDDQLFFIDTSSAVPPTSRIVPPEIRPLSPTASESSEEIVFHGRAVAQSRVLDDVVAPAPSPAQGNGTKADTVIAVQNAWDDSAKPEWVHRSKPGIGWTIPRMRKTAAQRPRLLTFKAPSEDSMTSDGEGAVDDYLANVREHYPEFVDSAAVLPRDIDVALEDGGQVQKRFESLAVATVDRPTETHTTDKADESSSEYDDDHGDEDDDVDFDEVSDSEMDSDDDVALEDEMIPDGREFDDETLAMLLSTNEELGIDADELLLFDDAVDASVAKAAMRYMNEIPKEFRRHGKDCFPSATLLADVLDQDPYGGFDVMDFERPSLRKRKKGRKGQPFGISDDELHETLQATWENDRSKKMQKKLEREELRQQGVLGKKSLTNKYGEGMGIADIGREFELFLASDKLEKALPPMDKHRRKMIHEIASDFNIKTKSLGSGNKRFTTLIKTKSTTRYDDRKFSLRARKVHVSFFPRGDVVGKSKRAERLASRGGGATSAGVRYRDGDIVGGAAPEIGIENRGRAMLEKMGWASGQALGAAENKGILQPIAHIVKNSKLGLG